MLPPSLSHAFDKMLKQMLKPMIRLLLQKGITYPAFAELIKTLYVEVACESSSAKQSRSAQSSVSPSNITKTRVRQKSLTQNTAGQKRLTDSRVSLVTGIHRKEVKRLRERLAQTDLPEQAFTLAETKASLSATVMAKWLSEPEYLDDQGQPKMLPKNGTSNSFEALVYSVSKDKHYRSLLDDWLAQGVIEMTTVDQIEQVSLQEHGFIPAEDEEEKLFFAGKNLGAHMAVVTHNLSRFNPNATSDTEAPQNKDEQERMFDRAVYYQNLPAPVVKMLEMEAKKRNLATLEAINAMAAEAKKASLEASNPKPSQTPLSTHRLPSQAPAEMTCDNTAPEEADPQAASSSDRCHFHLGCYFYRQKRSD